MTDPVLSEQVTNIVVKTWNKNNLLAFITIEIGGVVQISGTLWQNRNGSRRISWPSYKTKKLVNGKASYQNTVIWTHDDEGYSFKNDLEQTILRKYDELMGIKSTEQTDILMPTSILDSKDGQAL